MKLEIVNHPIVSHSLHHLRDKNTPTSWFKHYCHLVSMPVILKATESIETETTEVTTPLETSPSEIIEKMPVFIPILRAGLGMLKVAQEIFPDSEVGHIGLERDEETAEARTYYQNLPSLDNKPVIVLDPMLATGGSAANALEYIKKDSNPSSVTLACIVAAPEGVDFISRTHPDVKIVTSAVDRELNEVKYIMPGLGDFGDRYFHSKEG